MISNDEFAILFKDISNFKIYHFIINHRDVDISQNFEIKK